MNLKFYSLYFLFPVLGCTIPFHSNRRPKGSVSPAQDASEIRPLPLRSNPPKFEITTGSGGSPSDAQKNFPTRLLAPLRRRRGPHDDAARRRRPRAGTAANPDPRARDGGPLAGASAVAAAGVPARLQRRPARARPRPRRGAGRLRPPPLPRRHHRALQGPAPGPPRPRAGHGPLPQMHQARIRERTRRTPPPNPRPLFAPR